MAKALLTERKSFLLWLADLIGAPIASLAGRTKLERPDTLTSAEIIEILLKHRQELTLDPGARSFRDRLAMEHTVSIQKISELSSGIAKDESEADAEIFDLYEISDSQRAATCRGRMVDASYAPE
jgi:hypothetical protein